MSVSILSPAQFATMTREEQVDTLRGLNPDYVKGKTRAAKTELIAIYTKHYDDAETSRRENTSFVAGTNPLPVGSEMSAVTTTTYEPDPATHAAHIVNDEVLITPEVKPEPVKIEEDPEVREQRLVKSLTLLDYVPGTPGAKEKRKKMNKIKRRLRKLGRLPYNNGKEWDSIPL